MKNWGIARFTNCSLPDSFFPIVKLATFKDPFLKPTACHKKCSCYVSVRQIEHSFLSLLFFFFLTVSPYATMTSKNYFKCSLTSPAQHPSWERLRSHSVVPSHQPGMPDLRRPTGHIAHTNSSSVHKSPNRADISDSTTLQSILHTTYDLVFLKQSYLHVLLIEFHCLFQGQTQVAAFQKLSLNSSPL